MYGLEQRRQSYMSRLRTQFMTRLGVRSETLIRESEQRRESIRRSTFGRVDECIQWVRVRLVSFSWHFVYTFNKLPLEMNNFMTTFKILSKEPTMKIFNRCIIRGHVSTTYF